MMHRTFENLVNRLTESTEPDAVQRDARMERVLRRPGWPIRSIGKLRPLGKTVALAGYLEVSTDALERIRKAGRISGPVLWAPVMRAAA